MKSLSCYWFSKNNNISLLLFEQAQYEPERSGFTGAIGPKKAIYASGGHIKADIIQYLFTSAELIR